MINKSNLYILNTTLNLIDIFEKPKSSQYEKNQ